MNNKTIKSAVASLLAVLVLLFAVACTTKTPTPTPEPTPTPIDEVAFHVATNGNDGNDGSIENPFATIQKAVNEARNTANNGLTKPVTVYIHGGEYRTSNIDISNVKGTAECPVTIKAYNNENVVLNAGVTVTMNDFAKVSDPSVLSRLSADAQENVVVCDLTKLGLSFEDIGELSPVGADVSALMAKYGVSCQPNVELFWNDVRMTNARYPDTDYLYTVGLADEGDPENLVAGTVILDSDTVLRMSTWQDLSSAWMFSYPRFLWSESTSPIASIDTENNTVTNRYTSYFGYAQSDARYYFYNVLEELTVPGEYYIDRDNMLLYFYPTDDKSAIGTISVSKNNIITGNGNENLVLDGLTLKGTRGDGINISGDYITVINCTVKSIYGLAICVSGYNNTIYGCEAFSLGKGGIYLTSGDKETITRGNSVVENCYVHDYSQVYTTYMQAILSLGCGNKIIHNEVAYAPHLAVSYSGPEMVVEYNYIHDVCLESHDCGALYIGGDYLSCNAQVRYNYFKNIGHEYGDCIAIYFDDCMSSGNVYGNIVDNCYGSAIRVNGGREMKIKNNLIIGNSNPMEYNSYAVRKNGNEEWDFRTADAIFRGFTWSPYWSSELWQTTYPEIGRLTIDYEKHADINFPLNPSYSVVKNNIFLGRAAKGYVDYIDVDVTEYSEVGYSLADENVDKFVDKTTYQVKTDVLDVYDILYHFEWEQIPFEQIGRYK